MKKTMILMSIFAFTGIAKAAYFTVDLNEAQEVSNSALDHQIATCQELAIDSKQLMSEFKRQNKIKDYVCEKELSNSLKKVCSNRIKILKEVANHFSEKSTNLIAKNLGDGAASDAIGAVQLWKARQSMQNLNESESLLIGSLLKSMTCKNAKNSLIAENASFSESLGGLVRLTRETTLRSIAKPVSEEKTTATGSLNSGAQ